jgi:hypothetical protein
MKREAEVNTEDNHGPVKRVCKEERTSGYLCRSALQSTEDREELLERIIKTMKDHPTPDFAPDMAAFRYSCYSSFTPAEWSRLYIQAILNGCVGIPAFVKVHQLQIGFVRPTFKDLVSALSALSAEGQQGQQFKDWTQPLDVSEEDMEEAVRKQEEADFDGFQKHIRAIYLARSAYPEELAQHLQIKHTTAFQSLMSTLLFKLNAKPVSLVKSYIPEPISPIWAEIIDVDE